MFICAPPKLRHTVHCSSLIGLIKSEAITCECEVIVLYLGTNSRISGKFEDYCYHTVHCDIVCHNNRSVKI